MAVAVQKCHPNPSKSLIPLNLSTCLLKKVSSSAAAFSDEDGRLQPAPGDHGSSAAISPEHSDDVQAVVMAADPAGAPAITAASAASSFLSSPPFCLKESMTSLRRPAGRVSVDIRCVSRPPAVDTSYKTNVPRNANMAKLQAGYLFPEIARRRAAHLLKYPDAKIISLGIGDTTEPIPNVITNAMAERAHALSTIDGYSGYGAEQGEKKVRAAIAATYYADLGIEDSDIFVFDGAKCDISLAGPFWI